MRLGIYFSSSLYVRVSKTVCFSGPKGPVRDTLQGSFSFHPLVLHMMGPEKCFFSDYRIKGPNEQAKKKIS